MVQPTKAPSALKKRICILTFFRKLLDDTSNQHIICWTDQAKQQFKLVNRQKVTELYGASTNGGQLTLTYDGMCRKLRHLCAAGKKLEKVKGSTAEWRFLDSECTMIPAAVDFLGIANDAQNFKSIQQLLLNMEIPTVTGTLSYSSEISKEIRTSTGFTIEEMLSDNVKPDATDSPSSSTKSSAENQESCSSSWHNKPFDFEIKSTRLTNIIQALTQRAMTAECPKE